jgi:hypothetical protein
MQQLAYYGWAEQDTRHLRSRRMNAVTAVRNSNGKQLAKGSHFATVTYERQLIVSARAFPDQALKVLHQ